MLNSSVSTSQIAPLSLVHWIPKGCSIAQRVAPEDEQLRMSMSEFLAHELVSRLTAGATRRHEAVRSRVHDRHTVKRAASYRLAREYIRNCVPEELRAAEIETGDPTRKSKDARYTHLHWDSPKVLLDQVEETDSWVPRHDAGDLLLVSSSVDSRHTRISYAPVMTAGRHALMRLFFRLRTIEEAPVLQEMQSLVYGFMDHYRVACLLGPGANLLMPTPHDAFVLTRMRERPNEMFLKTWMNVDRMVDNVRRQKAVIRARNESGIVLNELGTFPIISRQRLEAQGKMRHRITGKDLNAHCNQFQPLDTRLQADWRFIIDSASGFDH